MNQSAQIVKFPEKGEEKGREYVKADLDNGFYRVANEIGLSLCKAHLSDRESRILNAIMIKTFGWGKPLDWICNSQLSELTDIGITHISEVKNALISRKIIRKEGRKIGINTVVSQWELSKKTENKKHLNKVNKTPKQGKQTPKQGKPVPQTGAYKRKTLITKESIKRSCPEHECSTPEIELTNIFLPLNKKDTKHHVSVADFNEYQELYPGVDITRQFQMMFVWLRDNPKRKKTKTGVRGFITRWLSKEQNNSRGTGQPSKTADPYDTSWAKGLEVEL